MTRSSDHQPDLIVVGNVRRLTVSSPSAVTDLFRTALPTPEDDGLVRLLDPREVRIGGAAAEAREARLDPNPCDGGGE